MAIYFRRRAPDIWDESFLLGLFPVDTILTSECRALDTKFCSRHTNTEFIATKHIFAPRLPPARHLIFQARSSKLLPSPHKLLSDLPGICKSFISRSSMDFNALRIFRCPVAELFRHLRRSTTDDNGSRSIVLKLIIVAFYSSGYHMLG